MGPDTAKCDSLTGSHLISSLITKIKGTLISLLLINILGQASLGVVHNCHHFHERTQRTLGGEGVKSDRTLF